SRSRIVKRHSLAKPRCCKWWHTVDAVAGRRLSLSSAVAWRRSSKQGGERCWSDGVGRCSLHWRRASKAA
ncbi:hypothetical protein Dimus_024226, partial [Dionaea muscipula]